MRFGELRAKVISRWSDIGSASIVSAVNEIVGDMNITLEGERVSEICVELSLEVGGEFAGSAGLPEDAESDKYYICHTTGGSYTANQIILGDGSMVSFDGDQRYYCGSSLSELGFSAGAVIYWSGTSWEESGYIWIANRLTLKSGINRVISIQIDDEEWTNHSARDIDEDNNWSEYYEESRGVLRFNASIGSRGTMRIYYYGGLSELSVVDVNDNYEIDIPTNWQGVFMDGVLSRIAIWSSNDKELWQVTAARYSRGLRRLENYEANRLPYGNVRKW